MVLSAHPPVSHERHPPGFTVPLRWRGLSAFTPSLEGESKGVVSSAHPSVSHDRHPPVSHDCHPPVSPSPSGGGGYQPYPSSEGVTHSHPLFRGGIEGGGVISPPPVSPDRHPSVSHERHPSVSHERHTSVSHDRHPPVSHDRHPPVSPSPSGGGGY